MMIDPKNIGKSSLSCREAMNVGSKFIAPFYFLKEVKIECPNLVYL